MVQCPHAQGVTATRRGNHIYACAGAHPTSVVFSPFGVLKHRHASLIVHPVTTTVNPFRPYAINAVEYDSAICDIPTGAPCFRSHVGQLRYGIGGSTAILQPSLTPRYWIRVCTTTRVLAATKLPLNAWYSVRIQYIHCFTDERYM
jgi:hypothetical protein